jgi:hypothetical protein
MAVQPRPAGLAPSVQRTARATSGAEAAARRVLWRSASAAVVWIAGVSFTLIDMYTMNRYLRSAMGVPAPSGGNQFMAEFGGLLLLAIPFACAGAIAAALALYTAWRAFTAGRADRRGQRQLAVNALARGLKFAKWTRLTSIAFTILVLVYSAPAVGWLFGVSRGAPGDFDAVAGNLVSVEGTLTFVMTGLLAWWLAGTAVSAFHSVISPDGKHWWDGTVWLPLTARADARRGALEL